jgi:hypothetical protein
VPDEHEDVSKLPSDATKCLQEQMAAAYAEPMRRLGEQMAVAFGPASQLQREIAATVALTEPIHRLQEQMALTYAEPLRLLQERIAAAVAESLKELPVQPRESVPTQRLEQTAEAILDMTASAVAEAEAAASG